MQEAVLSRMRKVKDSPERAGAKVSFELAVNQDEQEEQEDAKEEACDIAKDTSQAFLNSGLGASENFQEPGDE